MPPTTEFLLSLKNTTRSRASGGARMGLLNEEPSFIPPFFYCDSCYWIFLWKGFIQWCLSFRSLFFLFYLLFLQTTDFEKVRQKLLLIDIYNKLNEPIIYLNQKALLKIKFVSSRITFYNLPYRVQLHPLNSPTHLCVTHFLLHHCQIMDTFPLGSILLWIYIPVQG